MPNDQNQQQGDQSQQGNPEEAPVPARKPMRDTVTGEPAEGGDQGQQQGDNGGQAA